MGLFSLSKPKMKLRKNVFDLSEKTLFSMSAGLLVPVFTRELNPGEKCQVSVSSLTRTQPLNTAAFVRNRQYFHFFFVPYKQLWKYWDTFYTGTEYRSSVVDKSLPAGTQVPGFKLFKVLLSLIERKRIIEYGVDSKKSDTPRIYDELGFHYYRGISRLLDMLGYGFTMPGEKRHFNEDTKKWEIIPFQISTFSDLVDYYLDVSKLYDPEKEDVTGVTYITTRRKVDKYDMLDDNGHPSDAYYNPYYGSITDVDFEAINDSGKKELIPMYGKLGASKYYDDRGNLLYKYKNDNYAVSTQLPSGEAGYKLAGSGTYVTDVNAFTSEDKVLVDRTNDPAHAQPSKTQIDNETFLARFNQQLGKMLEVLRKLDISVNPFRLLAYQKIYSDFYRREDYEGRDPSAFNIDDFDGSIDIDGTVDDDRLLEMLRMRYRWLPKDYFTGVVPSEYDGAAGLFPHGGTKVNIPGDVDVDAFLMKENGYDNVSVNDFSVKSIRAAFALEKLLRLSRRAGGKDYISQIAARFGFEPPKGRGDQVEFLGGYSSNINISEVLTTANTLQGTTGQIFGQGTGSMQDSKDIKFTAKEHGILMCIASVVPDSDYSGEGLNPFNTKFHRGDYFNPEFQDLGLQPIFGEQLKNDISRLEYQPLRTNVLGYSPMYSEYKTAYDSLHGSFRNGRSNAAWSSGILLDYDKNPTRTGLLLNTLKVNPSCLDRIFSRFYDGSEETDQFLVSAQFICKVIRPMSISGQNM